MESYIAVAAPSAAVVMASAGAVSGGAKGGGPPPRAEQISKAIEILKQIPELRPEVWERLDLESRRQVLQSIENHLARVQGRPPCPIRVERMNPREFGGYDRASKTITVSEEHIASDDIYEIIDTIVHEGRHAYQHYAVEHPGFHSDEREVKEWKGNFEHYLPAEIYGMEIYRSQPIEADAWSFAEEVIKRFSEVSDERGEVKHSKG